MVTTASDSKRLTPQIIYENLFGARDSFSKAILENLGLDPFTVKRLIIDCHDYNKVSIYVECHGTDEVLNVVPPNVNECEVTILRKDE